MATTGKSFSLHGQPVARTLTPPPCPRQKLRSVRNSLNVMITFLGRNPCTNVVQVVHIDGIAQHTKHMFLKDNGERKPLRGTKLSCYSQRSVPKPEATGQLANSCVKVREIPPAGVKRSRKKALQRSQKIALSVVQQLLAPSIAVDSVHSHCSDISGCVFVPSGLETSAERQIQQSAIQQQS